MKAVRKKQQSAEDEKRAILAEFRAKCLLRETLRELESDAFYRYSHRSGGSARRSSWELLAEMSHYGGKTRLLDWSESLSVAVFFALREYRGLLDPVWASDRKSQLHLHRVEVEGAPTVWVLNPYLLSLYATNGERSSIWDFSFDAELDYYRTFGQGVDKWPFEFPIPIYPPWRDLRIAAQRGVFTVQGTNSEPLECQRPGLDLRDKLERLELKPKRIVQPVELDLEAAVYGAYHLRRYEGLTQFVLFRDTDSLGRSVRSEMEEAKLFRMGWPDRPPV